ncbi:hypothetical protein Q7P37_009263 [Cladosporium fusiforme]
MAPPLNSYNDVLSRTVRNLEQAQRIPQHHLTVNDILQRQGQASTSDDNAPDMTSLPSTNASMASNLNAVPSAASDDGDGEHHHQTHPPPLPYPQPTNLPILTANLNESTALLQNLQTRNAILSADLARATASLAQHEQRTSDLLSEQCRSKAKWTATAVCSFAIWIVYVFWCWCMRVEFEYIRKRRGEVLGL